VIDSECSLIWTVTVPGIIILKTAKIRASSLLRAKRGIIVPFLNSPPCIWLGIFQCFSYMFHSGYVEKKEKNAIAKRKNQEKISHSYVEGGEINAKKSYVGKF